MNKAKGATEKVKALEEASSQAVLSALKIIADMKERGQKEKENEDATTKTCVGRTATMTTKAKQLRMNDELLTQAHNDQIKAESRT